MKNKLIDLHTHSTCSDGSMTPTELVKHAAENGICAIALTDHDTVSGVEEAVRAGERYGVEVVPAIEFSVKSQTETHILGYFIDIHNPRLKEILGEIIEKRIERNVMTAKLLKDLGFDVTLEEAASLAPGGVIGRAHFARVMMNKGYVSSVKEAFEKYLSSDKPAYFGNQKLEAKTTIEAIHSAGGVAFLAHPHLIKISDEELEKYLNELKSYGLDGLEGYYTDYDEEMQEKFQAMAKRHGLKLSGGTDFHAAMKPHISIGKGTGNMVIPYSVLEQIKEIIY
ncbi:MAG: PHP domain-containing protein [Clostridia bacterium]|nr:PHP domain-containing protein [Clostridia bacterium]